MIASVLDGVASSAVDRWIEVRNAALGSAAFQRWAARFPLTRRIARHRAGALFDLCAGFVYSQVLHATVEVGLLEALRAGPKTLDVLAADIGLTPDAAERLAKAAASLDLLQHRGGTRYALGVHGAALLANPAVAAMVAHNALFYRDLADPVALLRGETKATALGSFWTYATSAAPSAPSERNVAGYSELMARSLGLIADDVLEAYPHVKHARLLDVGGGEGAFLEAAAARAPNLALTLFDLPPVADRARARLDRAGLGDRATVIGGDVFRDPLPTDADLVSLVRVLHDHDDEAALAILQSVRRSIRPDGVLLVAEPMSGTPGALPMGDAYFGFYLMAMGQGRPRTVSQLQTLLTRAGFTGVRQQPTRRPMLTQLVTAHTV